jgi:hypothetical protein
MKKNRTIKWSVHLMELTVVTLGILIAFGLNSWNENRKQEHLANSYLSSLKEELSSNKTELILKLDYHNKLLSSLRNDPLNTNLTLNPATLSNVGWLSGDNIIRDYIEPEMYRKIVRVYQTHEDLANHTRNASENMSEINIMAPFHLVKVENKLSEIEKEEFAVSLKKGWIPIFESWTAIEQIYIEQIDDALADWDHDSD